MTRITAAAEAATEALKRAVDEPGSLRNREAAEKIVHLRQLFEHEGITDWAGRSAGYRDLIERLYRQAGVPSDSKGNFQANLRYHLGNVLRTVAPPAELEMLGMAAGGPLARVRGASRGTGARSSRRRSNPGHRCDPAQLAALALDAILIIASMDPPASGPDVEGPMREIINEALNILSR